METPEVLIDIDQRIATVTINRPHRRNALSRAVVEQLTEAFDTLGKNNEVGVIVITGQGDKAFCAGGDLADQQPSNGPLDMHLGRRQFADLLITMHHCTRPIIARVQGHALGGGFGLALNCDIVIASESATFGTPEIKVGLFPMMIMAVIARNIGRKKAMEMMLTGQRLSGQTLVEVGIANSVVPNDQLDEAVTTMAKRIAGFSPAVLQLGRQAFYKTQDMGFEQALNTLHNELTINTLTEDAAEGIMAFFAGRQPEWKGR